MANGTNIVTVTIEVNLDTGKVLSTNMTCGERQKSDISTKTLIQLFTGQRQFTYVGMILHSTNSPGCVYWIGDIPIELC
jgi:hypothetical protein